MKKIQCSKCNGKGTIDYYANIAGGVCFSCNGKGYHLVKDSYKPSLKWLVTAIEKDSGKEINICYITEKTEEKALNKAIKQLSKGNGYYAESAKVAIVE